MAVLRKLVQNGKRIVKGAVAFFEKRIDRRKAVKERIRKILEENENIYYKVRYDYISYVEKLPLNEKLIMVESKYGMEPDVGILYLLKHMKKTPEYAGYKVQYICKGKEKDAVERCLKRHGLDTIDVIVLSSAEYFKTLATAKYLINDRTITNWWIKREGQRYLHLCLDTPLKCVGRKAQEGFADIGNMQKNYFASDYMYFPNEFAMQHLLKDYMIENLAGGKCLIEASPRNEVFFDTQLQEEFRASERLDRKRVYAFVSSFRGNEAKGKLHKNDAFLLHHLFELDKALEEDEVCYVSLHPMVKEMLSGETFRHIREIPEKYDLYEVLSCADVLITDYSEVLFDFAVTKRKIIQFIFDYEDCKKKMTTYLDIMELPFTKVWEVPELVQELRSSKNYDDTEFLTRFCTNQEMDVAKHLCDALFFDDTVQLQVHDIPKNGKKNIMIYAGILARNGLTQSVKNLLSNVDLEENNYILVYASGKIKGNEAVLKELPEKVAYIGMVGSMPMTLKESFIRAKFIEGEIGVKTYLKKNGRRIKQDWKRNFSTIKVDTVIQFGGYESEMILMFGMFEGESIIFVHNDMRQEIKMRQNQRKDVLRYAYNTYDSVAVVTEDLIKSTASFTGGRKDHIKVCRNVIDYKTILKKSREKLKVSSATEIYPSQKVLEAVLASNCKKIISIGRFSPEKGHFRLLWAFARVHAEQKDARLIIMGGVEYMNYYKKTIRQIQKLGMEGSVVLIKNLSNPYTVLQKCDGFILSSFYEGFGLVIAEADVLGKPVASTDVVGPRGFMRQYKGTLVEDSEEGIYQGIKALIAGEIEAMNVDYEEYNKEAIREFYRLLDENYEKKDVTA